MKCLALSALVLATLGATRSSGAPVPAYSCATHPAVTGWARSALHMTLQSIDTALAREAGLRTVPESVSVVLDDATCSKVIVAHNAFHKDSVHTVRDSAVVLMVGTSYGLQTIGAAYSFICIYDSTLKYRVTYEWMD